MFWIRVALHKDNPRLASSQSKYLRNLDYLRKRRDFRSPRFNKRLALHSPSIYQHRRNSRRLGCRIVQMLRVANMHRIARRHAETTERRFEDLAVRFGIA